MHQSSKNFTPLLEDKISEIEHLLSSNYNISKRSIAILLLQNDGEITNQVIKSETENSNKIINIVNEYKGSVDLHPLHTINLEYKKITDEILDGVIYKNTKIKRDVANTINGLILNPFTGGIILIIVLYLGFYQFVGIFGAGVLVGLLEENVFDAFINPIINNIVNKYIPWEPVADLLANEYGIFTMALKYSIAIVLPIVGCFFLMFSIIEDSGYLPRISFLLDRIFKKIGLNGRAVIPMTLGFGCDTMATMVSRTLETKRERIIATFLLALAIPCSAQLGVILALLSAIPLALFLWIIFMTLIFLLVGILSAKVLPGQAADFYIELPPLRMPKLINVIKKTYARMYWYLIEVLPLFILASILLWAGNLTGIFGLITEWLVPVVRALGLPAQMGEIFLYGFFRRDFGAAGLLDLQSSGILDGRQLVVSAVTLTLFVPCIAQFTMMIKERGWKTACGMAAFIFPFAFGCGFVLNFILEKINIL
jgi:ferrous iron transport protein B